LWKRCGLPYTTPGASPLPAQDQRNGDGHCVLALLAVHVCSYLHLKVLFLSYVRPPHLEPIAADYRSGMSGSPKTKWRDSGACRRMPSVMVMVPTVKITSRRRSTTSDTCCHAARFDVRRSSVSCRRPCHAVRRPSCTVQRPTVLRLLPTSLPRGPTSDGPPSPVDVRATRSDVRAARFNVRRSSVSCRRSPRSSVSHSFDSVLASRRSSCSDQHPHVEDPA